MALNRRKKASPLPPVHQPVSDATNPPAATTTPPTYSPKIEELPPADLPDPAFESPNEIVHAPNRRQGLRDYDRRVRRLNVLTRAFVRFDGNIPAAIQSVLNDLSPAQAELLLKDPWFKRNFDETDAATLLEEGIFLNLAEMAISRRAGTLPAATKLLQALNKERYNPGVQQQQTANEGLTKALRLVATRPLTQVQLTQVLVHERQYTPIKQMPVLEIPTLDQALEQATAAGDVIEVQKIEEDKDLRDE